MQNNIEDVMPKATEKKFNDVVIPYEAARVMLINNNIMMQSLIAKQAATKDPNLKLKYNRNIAILQKCYQDVLAQINESDTELIHNKKYFKNVKQAPLVLSEMHWFDKILLKISQKFHHYANKRFFTKSRIIDSPEGHR